MHRAEFKVIAAVVREQLRDKLLVEDFNFFVIHLSNELSQFNDNFNHDKFHAACGKLEREKN